MSKYRKFARSKTTLKIKNIFQKGSENFNFLNFEKYLRGSKVKLQPG
jgi:hypothetical protein